MLKELRRDRPTYMSAALVWLAVLGLGWGVMKGFWQFSYRDSYQGFQTLPYYLSANWGDSLILPTVCSIAFVELRRSWNDVPRGATAAGFATGAILGAWTQYRWTSEDGAVRNWTFEGERGLNTAGWYHAVFLVVMCGIFFGLTVALVSVGRSRKMWARGSALRYMTVGYLVVLFTALLATDNMRRAAGLDPSDLDVLDLLAKPLLVSLAVVLCARLCRLEWRAVASYAAPLAATTGFVPLALVFRGLSPVDLVSGATGLIAFAFGLFFVTAPSSASHAERLTRSLPTAVIAAVAVIAITGDPVRLSWEGLVGMMVVVVAALMLSSVPVCLFDERRQEALYTGRSALVLVLLLGVQVNIARGGDPLMEVILSVVFPLGVIVFSGTWVDQNFRVLTEAERKDSETLGAERTRRYGLLTTYMLFAIIVLMSTAEKMLSRADGVAISTGRLLLCAYVVGVMICTSYLFSSLSYRNNVFVLRGVDVNRWTVRIGGGVRDTCVGVRRGADGFPILADRSWYLDYRGCGVRDDRVRYVFGDSGRARCAGGGRCLDRPTGSA